MKKIFLILLLVAATTHAGELEYKQTIMGIFDDHLDALEMTVNEDFKYSDNSVQHIVALQKTMGFLDCGNGPLSESIKALRKSARKGEDLKPGIQKVKDACNTCHVGRK